VVEPGVFDVMVGPSSAQTQTAELTVEKPTLMRTASKPATATKPQ
jgi:hypothetical protein